ncbi:putative virulence-associated protein D [Candidatus Regiella insecticola 5.15]|uniref:Endoribonuclease VapD n=1 Tax=Candidatus Regiella insecticola 5.15 TaxID=1005043 RepID=G2H143_9ENTR|nr:virulence factor [Candidatus Regiella insecticola]EGY28286.1 putative virulence-associated protein D [Candidatus Regiella insecticola 5.15]
MFAIAFDLVVAETEKHHPKGVTQAYTDIGAILHIYGFNRVQGSLYLTDNEDMANLFRTIDALKKLAWFSPSVRDIRSLRVEQWSDFTSLVKEL